MPPWEDISPYTEARTRVRRFSWTNLLILLNLAGFIVTGILLKSSPEALSWLEFDKSSAIGQLRLWQFFSYSFVQMMDPRYIPWLILGVYALFTIGNELEAEIGSARTLAIYFACAAYGALAHALVQTFLPALFPAYTVLPAATLGAPVLGISAAAARRWPRRPILFLLFIPLRLRAAVLLMGAGWLACTLWFEQGFAASLGALAASATIGWADPRIDRAFDTASLRRERDRFVEEVEVRRRTDGILDKITREGMGSLTRTELKTLKQASAIFGRGKARPHE
jgi:membrane associated rhomboid family serine protease